MADLKSKIEAFLDVWQVKVGQSALDAVNNALGYSNQQTDLQPDFKVQVFDNGSVKFALTLKASDGREYWQYIEYGVNGFKTSHGSKYNFKDNKKYPSPKAFKSFIDKRGIQPAMSIEEHNKELKIKGKGKLSRKIRKSLKQITKDKAEKSLLFALSRSVKKNGIKPKPFKANIMTDDLLNELKTGMAKIFGEEVIATIKLTD